MDFSDPSVQVNASESAVVDIKLGVLQAAVTASPTTRAKAGDTVTVTVTLTNRGPIDVTNVTVTPPTLTPAMALVSGSSPCTGLTVTKATGETAGTKTCTATYTVVAADLLATDRTLAFGVVANNQATELFADVPAQVTLTVPIDVLHVDFTAAECAPWLAGGLLVSFTS
jgi:uncharacterized repeat protein (TIGR01451 family)